MNFRPAGEFTTFVKRLIQLKNKADQLLIWQTIDGKKKTVKGTFLALKQEEQSNVAEINMSKTFAIMPSEEVFIYAEEIGLLFKGKYDSCEVKNLEIRLDDKVFLRENRKTARIAFQFTVVNAAILKGTEQLKFELKDVNEYGFSVLLSAKAAKRFTVGEQTALCGIHGISLPRPVVAQVIHSSKVEDSSKKKIGFKFRQKSRLLGLVIKNMGLTD